MNKVQISIWATPEEVQMFDRLKKHLMRRTNSDLIRHLINQEDKKILEKNISNEIKQSEAGI